MQWLKTGKQLVDSFAIAVLGLAISPLLLWASDALDVALPKDVTILLKDGNPISGVRLVDIDSQTQIVKFSKGGTAGSRGLNQVKSIAFEGRYELILVNQPVVRGENFTGCSDRQTTMTVPINDFKVAGGTQAVINLTSLSATTRKDIRQVSKVRGFVVSRLEFDGKGAIAVSAKACAPK